MDSIKRHYSIWALAAVIAAYSFLRLWYITPMLIQVGGYDEGVYTMGAKLISQGQVPYRDFLLVHPPLFELVLAGIFEIFGYNFIFARVFVSLISIASFILIYLVANNLFKSKIRSLLAVALCMVLPGVSLFWFTIMLEPLGILFLLLGLLLLTGRKPLYLWAGLCFGLAIVTKYTFAPIVIGIALALFISAKSVKWGLIAGCFVSVLSVAGYFLITEPPQYINQTVLSLFSDIYFNSGMNRAATLAHTFTKLWVIIPLAVMVLTFIFRKVKQNMFLLISIAVAFIIMVAICIPAERMYCSIVLLSSLLFVGILPDVGLLHAKVSVKALLSPALIVIVLSGSYIYTCQELYGVKNQIEYENELAKKIAATIDHPGVICMNPTYAVMTKNVEALSFVDIYGEYALITKDRKTFLPLIVKEFRDQGGCNLVVDLYSNALLGGSVNEALFKDLKLSGIIYPSDYPIVYKTGFCSIPMREEFCYVTIFSN